MSAEDLSVLFWEAVAGCKRASPIRDGVNSPQGNSLVDEVALLNGADYPANAVAALRYCVPREIQLDNALAHLADHVQHTIADNWGARVKLGKPKTPKGRPHVESDIGKLASRLLHKLPATTGSGPNDPLRKASERRAVPRVSSPGGAGEQ
jgi:hypothetical protein